MQPNPITVSGPPPASLPAPTTVQARFDAHRYDEQVFDKGNRCELEKAVPCPCASDENGSALGTCISCGGRGRIVVERREVPVLVSGMGAGRKQYNWTEQNIGTASLTFDSHETVAVGDRVRNLTSQADFSEQLPAISSVTSQGDTLYYPTYAPTKVTSLLAFLGARQPLRQLTAADYRIEPTGAIRVLASADLPAAAKLSARYLHHPTYEIIDVPRDQVFSPAPSNNPRQENGQIDQLNQHCVGRKLQYFQRPARPGKYELLDNTPPPIDLNEYIAASNPEDRARPGG